MALTTLTVLCDPECLLKTTTVLSGEVGLLVIEMPTWAITLSFLLLARCRYILTCFRPPHKECEGRYVPPAGVEPATS